jgi:hypothetical protein
VKRSKNVLLLGAAVALALPALAGAQVTPFSFIDEEVRMEFDPIGSGAPHTFDLRSLITIDDDGTFDPSQHGATITISQNGKTLFRLPMPTGSGWRFEDRRVRFDGDVAGVALSVDFIIKSGGTLTSALPGERRVAEMNFEGDAAGAPDITCVEGIAPSTKVFLEVEPFFDETTVPAQC